MVFVHIFVCTYVCYFFAGEVKLPGADEMADLYEAAVQVLSDAGLHRYASHLIRLELMCDEFISLGSRKN